MDDRKTEHPEVRDQREDQSEENNAGRDLGAEGGIADGENSNDNASAECADTTVIEIHEQIERQIMATQNEGCMSQDTHPEEDFQGFSMISDEQHDEGLDGDVQYVNNHLVQLMGCIIMALECRILMIEQTMTILQSVMMILTRILEIHNLITSSVAHRCDVQKIKYKLNKRKNAHLDTKLKNVEHRLRSLECHGPQDGSIFLQIDLRQHVSIESGIFYTRSQAHNGYKMKIMIDEDWVDVANGTGRNFNVYFTILEGEMDALLPWPFLPQISFTFIDSQGGHHVRRATQEAGMKAFQRPTGNSVQNEQKHFCFNILFREIQHCIDDGDILCLLVEVHNDYRSLAASRAPE